MSSDVSWHIRDKLRPMPKHGSVLFYVHGNQKARVRTDSPGWPPRLSHSSWTMRKRSFSKHFCIYTSGDKDTGVGCGLELSGWSVSEKAQTDNVLSKLGVILTYQIQFKSNSRMYLWWSLCTLYLHACQVGVSVGDSVLCCCTCDTYFKR